MHFQSTLIAAGALLFATGISSKPMPVMENGIVRRSIDLTARAAALEAQQNRIKRSPKGTTTKRASDPAAQLQTVLDQLKAQVGPIATKIQDIANASPTTPSATTTSQMNGQYSALEIALNTAVAGVTHLLSQVKGDVNLLNLAQTIVDVIADLEPALVTVETGLALDPALAPLVGGLAAILNGPLVTLLTALEGLLVGLLPVVQGLLVSLGLTPLLLGLQGLVDGLLTALGL
ncbi:hypothetical protein T439DRAFT_334749 [Meredithblackwellia eburnea MCA 4105]